MKIISNTPLLAKGAYNIESLETSSLAMVLQTPTIFGTWYSIDAELSETIRGYRAVQDYIGPDSTLIFDKIEKTPMCGIDNLISTSQYNEEIAGFDEDFQSSGVLYPNTIFPKPNDFFVIEKSYGGFPALYIVTDVRPVTVRSNPFIEFQFRLFSREQETIDQLNRQVKDEYEVVSHAIGANKSLALSKKTKYSIEAHVNSYLEISALYTMLFYDKDLSAFVFDGLPGGPGGYGPRRKYVDMYLWKFMFDEGIIVYDEVANYASSDDGKPVRKIYISSPDRLIDEYAFTRGIFWSLYACKTPKAISKSNFDEYRFPRVWEPTPRITKYQGINIWYVEGYDNVPCGEDMYGDFFIWDDEFVCRIRNNEKYPEVPMERGVCSGCGERCVGSPPVTINPYLRNAVISHFNGEDINWESLVITDDKTVENYYLIPFILGLYKQFIQSIG